jgi:hypothetical protein
MRRTSKICGVKLKTIDHRLRFFSILAKAEHQEQLLKFKQSPSQNVLFDEMRTSEHTKCKPLSIALAVEDKTRFVLGFEVFSIPADGHLAKIAHFKYGPRPHHREIGLRRLFSSLKPIVDEKAEFRSDEWPEYPSHIRRHFPLATHKQVKGERGSIVGQGELKKVRFDPLFSLNHTCAMFRANVSRLIRRTWCTTKLKDRLVDHLWLYVAFHNRTFAIAG